MANSRVAHVHACVAAGSSPCPHSWVLPRRIPAGNHEIFPGNAPASHSRCGEMDVRFPVRNGRTAPSNPPRMAYQRDRRAGRVKFPFAIPLPSLSTSDAINRCSSWFDPAGARGPTLLLMVCCGYGIDVSCTAQRCFCWRLISIYCSRPCSQTLIAFVRLFSNSLLLNFPVMSLTFTLCGESCFYSFA